MKRGTLFILTALLDLAACAGGELRCARDIARAAFYEPSATNQLPFRFTGHVTYIREAHDFPSRIIAVEDETGAVTLTCPADDPACANLAPGDMAEMAGIVRRKTNVSLRQCRVISSGPAPQPVEAEIADFLDGKYDFRLARFSGTLRDVAESETAPRWLILVVCNRRERMFISVPDRPGTRQRLVGFIGRRITATGVCVPQDPSRRFRTGRTFKVRDGTDVNLTEKAGAEYTPDISEIRFMSPAEILSLGRHSATGRIVAVWQRRHALLAIGKDYKIADLEFADGVAAPHYGDSVRVVGLPESDLFRINLTNAEWTKMPAQEYAARPAEHVSARDICRNAFGYRLVRSEYHGKTITLKGTVRSLPDGDDGQMHIECDGLLITVDASALPDIPNDIAIGCEISVSGTCVVYHEKGRHSAAFPRLDGFSVVLCKPDDIVILSHPPWWTPRRLTFALSGLVALLLCVIGSNGLKKRATARMAKISTDLKVEERTRLAVELHDSLAQNLTGVSLEIDTADRLADENPAEMHKHLDRAARTLRSCRNELRNCLWDLRNRALEETSLDEAIRQTLAPHVAGAEIAVRFNVPRERISDNTAHAILRIIRELATNAVRHGQATKIWIAGGVEGDRMLFSVRDNGAGFDPATAPGFAEGHYGLVGISERVEALEGEFSIDSAPGQGAHATVAIKLSYSSYRSSQP